MGKRSLLGDPPGSAGSLRQQAMGEKLTDQVKGNGDPAKLDGRINDGEAVEEEELQRVGRGTNTTFKRNERRESDSSRESEGRDPSKTKMNDSSARDPQVSRF